LSTLFSAGLLFVVGVPFAGAAVRAQTASGTKITVSAVEFKFKLSHTSISKPGVVAFDVTNNGTIAHDFKIDGKVTRLLEPGKSTTLNIDFTAAGSFTYMCTVPGHAGLGMMGTFKVL
jgi:uncharacterized cupredoxin-like copper-binding protein